MVRGSILLIFYFKEREEFQEKLSAQTAEWKEAVKHRELAKQDFEEVRRVNEFRLKTYS